MNRNWESLFERSCAHLLLNDGPFYAKLLSYADKIETKLIPTLATKIEKGRISIMFNPEFIEHLDPPTLSMFIEHELQHVVRKIFSRRETRDAKIFNIANDIVINDSIPGFPDETIIPGIAEPLKWCKSSLPDYKVVGIRPNDSTENNYDTLFKNKEKLGLQTKGNITSIGGGSSPCMAPDIDCDYSKERIKNIIINVGRSTETHYGKIPGMLKQIFDKYSKNKIEWKNELRRFICQNVAPHKLTTWKRPNKRFKEQRGFRKDYFPQIMLWIDTSGSVGNEQINAFFAEIHGIHEVLKVDFLVGECDCSVGKVFKYTNKLKYSAKEITGRGGTDFRPPFQYIKEKKLRLDGIIYFTDLMGPFPTEKLKIPTLWVNTYQKETKAPFGKT